MLNIYVSLYSETLLPLFENENIKQNARICGVQHDRAHLTNIRWTKLGVLAFQSIGTNFSCSSNSLFLNLGNLKMWTSTLRISQSAWELKSTHHTVTKTEKTALTSKNIDSAERPSLYFNVLAVYLPFSLGKCMYNVIVLKSFYISALGKQCTLQVSLILWRVMFLMSMSPVKNRETLQQIYHFLFHIFSPLRSC